MHFLVKTSVDWWQGARSCQIQNIPTEKIYFFQCLRHLSLTPSPTCHICCDQKYSNVKRIYFFPVFETPDQPPLQPHIFCDQKSSFCFLYEVAFGEEKQPQLRHSGCCYIRLIGDIRTKIDWICMYHGKYHG